MNYLLRFWNNLMTAHWFNMVHSEAVSKLVIKFQHGCVVRQREAYIYQLSIHLLTLLICVNAHISIKVL